MEFALWSVIVGLLLLVMALSSTVLARIPLSTAMLYLLVGIGVSPLGLSLLNAEAAAHSQIVERMTEVVVLLSLFTAGLKLSAGSRDREWALPLRLALNSMIVTVALLAGAAYFLLGLPLGASILLGAILAPTDPVLASDVQLQDPNDRDKLRFALTGEGGLNDGTAFPFVMLGLGLLGLHDLGEWGWRWVAIDVVWATAAGIAVGAVLGTMTGKFVLFLRSRHKDAVDLDDFIALGLVALAYGCALMLHGYGFLAVFAAGVAFRPRGASASAAHAVLMFNEQAERIGEVAIVITVGALLWAVPWHLVQWWFVGLLLLFVRPLAVWMGLARSPVSHGQRWLMGWFGIRGVGSLYYLMYAINHGLDPKLAQQLTALTMAVVVVSIVVHGVSVTPLMAAYERAVKSRRRR